MSQLGLFEELPQVAPKSFRATVVRSHYRRVAGDPDIASAEAKPDTAMQRAGEARPRTQKASTPRTEKPRFDWNATAPAEALPRTDLPHNGTKTSRAAAEAVDPARALSQKERIFRAVLKAMDGPKNTAGGPSAPLGATREEIAAATGIDESTVCARVRPIITGADTRYQLVEPGITRIGAEGARQKVIWVATEQHEAVETLCPECGGNALARLFEVARPSQFDPATPVYQCYLSVTSCTAHACWWWKVA